MNLFQIEKWIPQTLTNSKDIIQTDWEYARRSSRARSTRGQENEAWALYQKNLSRESWGDLSGDRYIICPKPPYPAEKMLNRRQLFFLANHNLPEQTAPTRLNLNGYNKNKQNQDSLPSYKAPHFLYKGTQIRVIKLWNNNAKYLQGWLKTRLNKR